MSWGPRPTRQSPGGESNVNSWTLFHSSGPIFIVTSRGPSHYNQWRIQRIGMHEMVSNSSVNKAAVHGNALFWREGKKCKIMYNNVSTHYISFNSLWFTSGEGAPTFEQFLQKRNEMSHTQASMHTTKQK